MEKDKKCQSCGKIYRGEGFKNVCTEECWGNDEYNRLYGKKRQLKSLDSRKSKEMNIQNKNESWVNKKEKTQEQKEAIKMGIIRKEKMRFLKHEQWSGKPYRIMRG